MHTHWARCESQKSRPAILKGEGQRAAAGELDDSRANARLPRVRGFAAPPDGDPIKIVLSIHT